MKSHENVKIFHEENGVVCLIKHTDTIDMIFGDVCLTLSREEILLLSVGLDSYLKGRRKADDLGVQGDGICLWVLPTNFRSSECDYRFVVSMGPKQLSCNDFTQYTTTEIQEYLNSFLIE